MIEKMLEIPSGWQGMETVPKDGTPVLLAQGELVGIYAYFDDGQKNVRGKPMGRQWHGIHIFSELTNYRYCGERGPMPAEERVARMMGIDDGAMWMPLPEAPRFNEPENTS